MIIEWGNILTGSAAVIAALGGAVAAYKSSKTEKGQKETKESNKSAQVSVSTTTDTILQKLAEFTKSLEELATEVRSNRIEVQNSKSKTEGELLNIIREQGFMVTKITLMEKAVQGMIEDALNLKKRKALTKNVKGRSDVK